MTLSPQSAAPVASLPRFPDSLPLDLSARTLFERAYQHTPPGVSDLAFGTLFGWQRYFDYRYTCVDDQLFVFFEKGASVTFLPPLLLSGSLSDPGWGTSLSSALKKLSAWAQERGMAPEFRFYPEIYAGHLFGDQFLITPERDYADYVYHRSDLAALEGRDYAAKRNLVRQFTRQYAWRYEMLGKNNLEAAENFVNQWQEKQKTENGILGAGAYCMACRLLKNFQELPLYGGLLFVEGTIVAATLGSRVDDFVYPGGKAASTVIVHHENALTEYKGAYQAINQQFCAHLPDAVACINREEDLGIPGLRKAKLSYHPALLLAKSRITLK